jgi:hypothetical protein
MFAVPGFLATNGIWKVRLEGLTSSWLSLPNYEYQKTDVHIKWGNKYKFGNMFELHKNWMHEYHLLTAFEIIEIFGEPKSSMDGGFRGRWFVALRFKTKDMAMIFKLSFDN